MRTLQSVPWPTTYSLPSVSTSISFLVMK
uniref:Uncharacterized protein n=1 Tax=Anguilla anguilla TaxID=7936 RepID=A0A0E9RKP0_ANGAN